MKRQLIEEPNKGEVQAMQQRANAKLKAWNDAVELVRSFAPLDTKEQKDEFFNDMLKYAVKHLRVKAKDFQDMLDDQKIIEFFSFPSHILRDIQKRVKADGQLKFNEDYSKIIIPDYSIYADCDEEIERLNASQAFIDAVENLKKYGYTIHFGELAKGTSYAVRNVGGRLEHQSSFIKKNRQW